MHQITKQMTLMFDLHHDLFFRHLLSRLVQVHSSQLPRNQLFILSCKWMILR